MKMYDTPQSVDKYLDIRLECGCGRTHYVPIKALEIGSGAINTLPEHVRNLNYKHAFILCDAITYKIAGRKCAELLTDAGLDATVHILTHLGFDEATLGEIVVNVPVDCDLMIGVGTGSITDITRFSSFRLHVPCFTVATGAPMDGFAASIGIMNVNNLKATMPAHNSEAIIGDTDILRTAPYRMTVAGFGDLIGKLSCLNDWELSHIINGEHYCGRIAALVKNCVDGILLETPRIKERDSDALGSIMRGLVLSGAAISLYGDSRPASGAEHHMSHFWEAIMEQRGSEHAMHGEQVATGTVLVLMLIEELLKSEIDYSAARSRARAYDKAVWEADIRRVYGTAAQEVIDTENKADKNGVEKRLRRIDSIEAHWDEIASQLKTCSPSDKLRALLTDIGCPCTPSEIGIDQPTLRDTLIYAKETRARYTVLQLIYDLGMLETLADRVIARLNLNSVSEGEKL